MDIHYKIKHPTVSISDDVKISNSEKQSVIEKLSKHSKKSKPFSAACDVVKCSKRKPSKKSSNDKDSESEAGIESDAENDFSCMIVKNKKFRFKSFKPN